MSFEEISVGETPGLIRRLLTRQVVIKLTIALALIVLLAMMFPLGESIELQYDVGAVWAQKDLIAPFSFPIVRDEKEYARDVEEAKSRVFDVFERDTAGERAQVKRLDEFFGQLARAAQARTDFRRSSRHHLAGASGDSAAFRRIAAGLEIPFSEHEWDYLTSLWAKGKLADMQRYLLSSGEEFLQTGILDRSKDSISQSRIAIRRGTTEEILPVDRFADQKDVFSLLENGLRAHYRIDEDAIGIACKIGFMLISPNIKYDASATDAALAAAIDAVPRTNGFVQENERIVSKHERITPDIKLKLEGLRRAKAERGTAANAPWQLVGTLLHTSIIIMLFGIYLYLFRKRIVADNRRLALLALLILIEGFFAYLTREVDVNAPIEYLIFVPAASMLLTIIFDSRVGFYGTVVIALVVAGIRGNDYSVAIASIVAGVLSVYSVRDMKNRAQMIRSLGFIFLGYALTIVALSLERFDSPGAMAIQLTFALANAVVSTVLAYGLLIFLEKVFTVTTDLTLMELSHFNHPLLRLLAERAPGTYHHSMTMANLAEAGAAAVGANEVLARVGAYFHDIGKIVKPTYFVENQKSSRNRHDKLSPRMSSLIIASHVKEGVALAHEHKLPEEVIEFIPMHHGTTRIDYFYNKALQLAQNSPDETKVDEINEEDYRYPGPKPQTKETGIMMLADAIEASMRTLDDPSPQRLEAAIDELIKKRFGEGELDECPLTLKDLTKIRAAFLNILIGVHHTRVKYPEPERLRRRKPILAPAQPPGGGNGSGTEDKGGAA